jgi:hypothetical protein
MIPSSQIASSTTGPATIQQVVVRPVTINSVTMKNFIGNFNYDSGTMVDAEIKIVLKLHLDYWWGVCIDVFFDTYCVGDNGSVNLGTIDTGWNSLGNLAVAGGKLALNVNQTTFGPFKMSPQPTKPVSVESIRAEEISMTNTAISTGAPALLGVSIPVPNVLGNPSIDTDDMEISQFSTDSIRMPPMSFEQIQAANIRMDSAESDGFQAGGSFTEATDWLNLAFVGFRLRVDITSTLKASKLVMNGLTGDVSVKSTDLSNFEMSMTLDGVDVQGLQINNINAPTVDIVA